MHLWLCIQSLFLIRLCDFAHKMLYLVQVLAEKGGSVVEEIIAHPKFRLLATMNPGGDFGKKELSPALRNRFTEIWVPPISDLDDLKSIVVDRFSMPELVMLADPMLQFWQWFQHHHETGRLLSVRDLLAWIMYINVAEADIGKKAAFIHGAFLVLLDGIGFGMGLSSEAAKQLKSKCLEHLFQLLPLDENGLVSTLSFEDWGLGSSVPMNAEGSSSSLLAARDMFGIHPFYIPKGNKPPVSSSFALAAPTTSRNALRILRAMQLSKPVLLEGSPGVGKTSLVAALAAASSHSLVRINLSEQTDIMDLLGSHLPVEGGTGAEFCWSDGVFLQALKAGNWVLLDELNLASQSVLEGLNACLDHRGELFIPELGCSFKCHSAFRVFACQNPLSQGGGRKGLPKSFLNRFTKVYMDTLSKGDFLFIAKALHPSLTESLLLKMIEFNAQLYDDTMVTHAYGNSGAPWEFNLRDILRWCELIEGARDGLHVDAPERFLDVIYLQRMRTADDRCRVLTLFQKVFNVPPNVDTHPTVSVSPDRLQIGLASLPRREGLWLQGDMSKQLQLLPGLVNRLEAAMHCVAKGWMCILVGSPATGKTSIVRLLATLTGNPLREFSLSTATDTTELLGCFEQFDLFRRWQEMVRSVYDAVKTLCSFCLALSGDILQADLKLNLVKSLLGSWTAFQKCSASSGNRWVSLEFQPDQSLVNPVAVDMLLQTVEKLVQVAVVCRMPVVNPDLEPHTLLHKVKDFKASMGQQQGKAGQFEWVDGGLLKAVEHGDWVVLENANFCNPTVS
jgi:midasin